MAGKLVTTLGLLAGTALGQSRHCDPDTSLCYSQWVGGNGLSIGVALPKAATAPFDTVLQIVSPIANGWVGFAWGGTMPYVPLTIGWPVSSLNTTIYSSRMAFGLSLPQPYAEAEYTYLRGTGLNATHWTLNVRCRGCSQWHDVDGNVVSLDPADPAAAFAHGLASRLPAQPANNRSTFNVHTKFGHWSLDLAQGQNDNFDKLVAENLIPDTPAPTASVPASSVTPPPSSATTLSTSVRPSSTGGPVQSGVPSSCSGVNPLHFNISTAPGWKVVKVAGELTQPRGVIFDKAGNLLLIQNGLGITGHQVGPDGCLTSTKTIVSQKNLNHGITLSHDGKTLYASSVTSVYEWEYDAATMTVSSSSKTVVTGMDTRGHVTRTLTIPPKHDHLLVVSHGSNDNFDYESGSIETGRSCVKVFDLRNVPKSPSAFNYASDGWNLGYGLRNEVGLAWDADGMLWGLENSSDEIHRTVGGSSTDIHIDNPADELNFLGDPSKPNNNWYGYPTCYTLWKPADITDQTFSVGDQFVLAPNATFDDSTCRSESVPAEFAIQAHSAPLDAVFSENYQSLFVTLHGSWNRAVSTGFKVIEVPFSNANAADGRRFGPRVSIERSGAGYSNVMWAPDEEHCGTTQCFRPVAIAVDGFGRMYITSDSGAEGEMIILGRV